MRLLNTSTGTLEEFFEKPRPKYAILSHRWQADECSFQDFVERRHQDSSGYEKIQSFCKFVRASQPSHQWVWIDTCCIDKRNSAELTEAINSMYEWYQEATVCFVYLVDLPNKGQASMKDRHVAFEKSDWFRRGWTLQELLAPSDVIFCDREWNVYGSRIRLATRIAQATGIDKAFLDGTYAPQEASVAMRMSWASSRSTTKTEDIAYCLLGIFGVSMPPIYGEKERAFARLQHEIIKSSDDESIFAWTSRSSCSGILAKSPAAFKQAGNILNIRLQPVERLPYFITNKGLHIRSASDTYAKDDVDRSTLQPMGYTFHKLQLGCFRGSTEALAAEDSELEQLWEKGALTVTLKRFGPIWQRVNCHLLGEVKNVSRRRRRNGSYRGRGVQRLYLVQL